MKVKEIIDKLKWGSHPTIIIKQDIRTTLSTLSIGKNPAVNNRAFAEMEKTFGARTVNSIEVLDTTLTIYVTEAERTRSEL